MHARRGLPTGAGALDLNDLLLKVLVSYLLGSIVGSLLVGRLRGGVDIRRLGSGNAGGTNALRTQGKSFALWVLFIDIGKGWIAARLIAPLLLPGVVRPDRIGYFTQFIRRRTAIGIGSVSALAGSS